MLAIIFQIAFTGLCWAVRIIFLPFRVLRLVIRKVNRKIKEISENANSQDY